MRRLAPTRAALAMRCVLLGSLWTCCLAAERLQAEPANGPAALLVQAALKAELNGDNYTREKLLNHALNLSPDYSQARWQSGYLQRQDVWLSISEANVQAAGDRRLQEYQELRRTHAVSAAGQEVLARWCRKNGMPEREKLHWYYVLVANPRHAEARRRLELREFRGMLLPAKEVEVAKQAMASARDAMDYWRPRLEDLLKDYQSDDPQRRTTALEQVPSLGEVAAIAACEVVLSEESAELGLAVVQLLSEMDQLEATRSLVRHAVFSSFPEVREAATAELKQRPIYSFVPDLMAGLQSPIEWYCYHTQNSEHVSYAMTLEQEGPTANYIRKDIVETALRFSRGGGLPISRRAGIHARMELSKLSAELFDRREREVEQVYAANRQMVALNQRIISVLNAVTGEQLGPEPQPWWEWWQDFNEVQSYYEEKPVVYQEKRDCRPLLYFELSCFLRGTKVWTETGPKPIEEILPGDRVLAQDPLTGELLHKLVAQTTLRPPSRTLRITVDNEVIAATPGHPFWVVGQGWKMAKQLEVGTLLHTPGGALPVERMEEGLQAEAYNLVVADVHTYFVGDHRLLVHDNNPREPITPGLPGLTGK